MNAVRSRWQTADRLLGRRYTFTTRTFQGGYLVRRAHDVTVVAFDPQEGYRLRGDDGSKAWFPEAALRQLFDVGALAESDKSLFTRRIA